MLVSTDTTIQLSIAKPHIKNILKDLLAGMKGFKSQITFHETFPKKIENGEIKFPQQIHLSSVTQTFINDLSID